jgi:RNA polymerase sigma-70 factor (ECF subfamily)
VPDDDPADRLSQINTLWSLVAKAHAGPDDGASAARRRLLERYAGAVHRYLHGALRDPEAAAELFQEFSVRFLRGDFRNAAPQHGRFRNFVKTAVFHLVVDHQKKARRQPLALSADVPEPAAPPDDPEADRLFLASWRDQLLDRTWLALRRHEDDTLQPHYTVLRYRTNHPQLSSEELAAQLGPLLGKELTVPAVRQALHRAREKFADLLLGEVEQSLGATDADRVADE